MLQILKRTQSSRFQVQSDMFKVYCKNIIPYMYLYKHQVEYYEKMVYNILEKDIGLILPKFGNKGNKCTFKTPKKTNNISIN